MISSFGYPAEAGQVLTYLKGIGEYDFKTQQYYFSIRNIYNYRNMLAGKAAKGKFETDFDFHEFFFKSISANGQEITEKDLDDTIAGLEIEQTFSSASTEKIIQRTEGSGEAAGISFG